MRERAPLLPGQVSQPRHVLRAGRDVVLRGRQHQIGHAGIVAAAARCGSPASICWRYSLYWPARRGWVPSPWYAPWWQPVHPIASVRAGRPRGDVGRRRRLLQIGPALLRKIERQRHHLVALQRLRERRHDVVLARAALEVAQLRDRDSPGAGPRSPAMVFSMRNAVLAVAGRAELRLLRDRLRRVQRPAERPSRRLASERQRPPCAFPGGRAPLQSECGSLASPHAAHTSSG